MLKKVALLVIDMQRGMASAGLPPRNNEGAEANMVALRDAWRTAGQPVVNVRHMSRSAGSVFFPGQQGAEFQERFAPLRSEHVVEKNVTDAFINTGLERWLHVRDICELVIVGVSTNSSVESTARTAGNLGFTVTVVSDATFAFEQRDFGGTLRSAEEVHLFALSNLQGEYANVLTTREALAELGA